MISFLRVGQMPAAPNCDYMESGCCTFQVNVFVPLQAARRNYLKECRKCTLLRFSFSGLWDAMWENSLKMSRYVASPGEEKKNTECKWWKMIRVRSDSSRRRKRKRKKKSLTWFFWTVKTSFIWNLWAEELWVRKKAAVKGAEAPWSFALSTLRILSLYFSCGHGNRWIHRHDKSSWGLLCPMRAPRPG